MTSWGGPALVLQPQGGQAHNHVVVDHSPFLVGRHSGSNLQLAHATVSGRHAEIVNDGDGWWIVDCESTNGTFVNGYRVEARARVEVGDLVHFANFGYEVVPARQYTTDEDSPATTTHLLTDSGDIEGMVGLFNIVTDQHTVPLFQPVVMLADDETYGWEALGRGLSADGPISPGRLFHLAGQNEIEAQLSERFRDSTVQCAVCRHCWPERTAPHLFFNLHPAEADQEHYDHLLAVLGESELQQSYRIVLEIHESLVVDTDTMKRLVDSAREHNVLVAFDDFGAGQSRLHDLVDVPPDFLKLDRSLVADLAKERVKHGLVKAIVDACRELDVMTLAEGIETEDELRACKDMGVDLGQGYLLGRPQSPFALFGADTSTLPRTCPFVRLDVVGHYV